jgi:hypothetical protein
VQQYLLLNLLPNSWRAPQTNMMLFESLPDLAGPSIALGTIDG